MKRLLPLLFTILFLLSGCKPQTDDVLLSVSEPEASAPVPADPDGSTIVFEPTHAPDPVIETQPAPAPANTPHEEDAVSLVTPILTPVPTPAPTFPPTPVPTPAPFVPVALPDTLRVRKNYTVIASPTVVRGTDGRCYSYGSVGGTEPCFYPCDGNGFVASGTDPAAVECTVPAYTPTDAPGKDGEKLLVVYLGSQSVVGFEGRDGDWTELRVMICSSGRRKHDTPVGNYRITDRYTYKILGTEDTHCYGLWACRFKDHYLFHSVPISYDAGRDSEMGHRMCDMHKFEKLGTVASDGCVRMTVADAKWIYELSESQRVNVRVVKDSGPTPVRPPAVIWEEPYTDKNGYGWDPTDPHPLNPYHNSEQP